MGWEQLRVSVYADVSRDTCISSVHQQKEETKVFASAVCTSRARASISVCRYQTGHSLLCWRIYHIRACSCHPPTAIPRLPLHTHHSHATQMTHIAPPLPSPFPARPLLDTLTYIMYKHCCPPALAATLSLYSNTWTSLSPASQCW